MDDAPPRPWLTSMHGGHSSEGSAHGRSTLGEMLDAAVAVGMHTFGVSNHAPISDARFLYDDERAQGLDLHGRVQQFEAYAALSEAAVAAYAGRLEVLRGFEAEVVPEGAYVADMLGLRAKYGFEYVVGSVHWVDEAPIDVSLTEFDEVVRRCGGLEALLVRYYGEVAEMVDALRPEVVGHLDLPRLFSDGDPAHLAPSVSRAVEQAFDAVAQAGSLVEVNSSALRKGLRAPYPDAHLVRRGAERGISFTLSDDSHAAEDVGRGLSETRDYLLAQGLREIHALGHSASGAIERRVLPL